MVTADSIGFTFPNTPLHYSLGRSANKIDIKLEALSFKANSPTHEQTEGPYYRPGTPLCSDFCADGVVGKLMTLIGKVLDTKGKPLAGAVLDFWQADGNGNYDHKDFNLRGHQYTDQDGHYQLQTVVPGCYQQELEHFILYRAGHIHVKVQGEGTSLLTTQLYFPQNVSENNQDLIFHQKLMLIPDKDGVHYRYDFVLKSM